MLAKQLPVGISVKGVCDQYGRFLSVLAPPGSTKTAVLEASRAIRAAIASAPAASERRQGLYRVSFSRSRQKRGPPSFHA